MAEVRPYRALRYNPQKVRDLSAVICPPFDTISPELQKALYQRSAWNVVRLELGEKQPSDSQEDNRYTRAAATLRQWLSEEVLVQDDVPGYYLIEHRFRLNGQNKARLELMACVRVEAYDRRVVLPHEHTRAEDKKDRLELIKACNFNLSPIMCLYRDRERKVASVLKEAMTQPPLMELSATGDPGYLVWKIAGANQQRAIAQALGPKPLYIADGHHRYETAVAYRNLRSADIEGSADQAFNFVMMGLIDFDDSGLMVLPYHRALRNLDPPSLTKVRAKLADFFQPVPLSVRAQKGLNAFEKELEVQGRARLVLGVLDGQGNGPQMFTLKPGIDPAQWGPMGQSEAWILHHQVLESVLGDSLGQCISCLHEGEEMQGMVKNGELQMGFFLKPFPLDLFETIMDAGLRLPPKSTFFYPKLATGLVINLLEGAR